MYAFVGTTLANLHVNEGEVPLNLTFNYTIYNPGWYSLITRCYNKLRYQSTWIGRIHAAGKHRTSAADVVQVKLCSTDRTDDEPTIAFSLPRVAEVLMCG